jgi:hypothetical protein
MEAALAHHRIVQREALSSAMMRGIVSEQRRDSDEPFLNTEETAP